MPLPFQGMMGRVLAQTLIRQQVRNSERTAAKAYAGSFQSSGKFLFVAHPNCCERCKLLGQTPHFFNTADVAFITHPNCMCATIEAPAGLSPAQLMEWAQNPTGALRFGFNYGLSLRPLNITEANREAQFKAWQDRMDPLQRSLHSRRLVRAKVSQDQVDAIREKVKSGELGPAKDYTNRINGLIKASKTRSLKNKKPTEAEFRMTIRKMREIASSQGKKVENERKMLRKGKIWNPNRKSGNNATALQRNNNGNAAVIQRDSGGNAAALQRNTRGFGYASRSMARRRLADERKKRREREKELKRRGFI